MRSGKISRIAAILTKSILVTKLIYSECGRSPEPGFAQINEFFARPSPGGFAKFYKSERRDTIVKVNNYFFTLCKQPQP
jgi:hypothetical protein